MVSFLCVSVDYYHYTYSETNNNKNETCRRMQWAASLQENPNARLPHLPLIQIVTHFIAAALGYSSIFHPAGWHWTHRVSKQIVMYSAMGGAFLAYKTTPPTGSTLLEDVGTMPHRTIPEGLVEMEPQEARR